MTPWVLVDNAPIMAPLSGSGKLALADGRVIRQSEAVYDRSTMEWYEDLKNSVGRAVAWLNDPEHRISLELCEHGDGKYRFTDRYNTPGAVRYGDNPVLLLLGGIAALTACYDGFDTSHETVDVMNNLDAMVCRAYRATVNIDGMRTTVGDRWAIGNPIFSLFKFLT